MKKISITLGITVALFSVANAQHHSVNAYQHQTNETFVVNNDGYANQEWNSESHSHQGHYKHHSENFHQEHYHYNSCADHSDYRPMSQFDFENAKQSIA